MSENAPSEEQITRALESSELEAIRLIHDATLTEVELATLLDVAVQHDRAIAAYELMERGAPVSKAVRKRARRAGSTAIKEQIDHRMRDFKAEAALTKARDEAFMVQHPDLEPATHISLQALLAEPKTSGNDEAKPNEAIQSLVAELLPSLLPAMKMTVEGSQAPVLSESSKRQQADVLASGTTSLGWLRALLGSEVFGQCFVSSDGRCNVLMAGVKQPNFQVAAVDCVSRTQSGDYVTTSTMDQLANFPDKGLHRRAVGQQSMSKLLAAHDAHLKELSMEPAAAAKTLAPMLALVRDYLTRQGVGQ
ncbi:MAG: hypothetical protein ACI9KE_000252 [Polyangiales bacterium]|jgi:hypothetical protein